MKIHNMYAEMSEQERMDVDHLFDVLQREAKRQFLTVAYDDRAERLVEAIAVYLKESRK